MKVMTTPEVCRSFTHSVFSRSICNQINLCFVLQWLAEAERRWSVGCQRDQQGHRSVQHSHRGISKWRNCDGELVCESGWFIIIIFFFKGVFVYSCVIEYHMFLILTANSYRKCQRNNSQWSILTRKTSWKHQQNLGKVNSKKWARNNFT